MSKVSVEIGNGFCPQTLYLHGTYEENGRPHFGLYGWFSFYWDGGLHVAASISGPSRTMNRIRANRMFSANLVTESLLPLADYMGVTNGFDENKMDVPLDVMPGAVLNVPVLVQSPWSFELEVERSVTTDGGETFFCKMRNVLADEALMDESIAIQERMRIMAPVFTARGASPGGKGSYYFLNPTMQGIWGDFAGSVKKINGGEGK